MDVKCENCQYAIWSNLWGEYKCDKKKRACTESEVIMGCSDYKQVGSKPDEPTPEIIVRSGATFTPNVSDDGLLSWTNDKGLANPKPVNLKPKDGYTPVKGVDYFDGKDGYTPVKGKDYTDGYTPVKGKDYFDGKDGYTPIKGVDYFDGEDGYTPVKGKDYFDGEPGKDGYSPIKGVDYFDGQPGKDGDDGHTPVKGKDYFDGADGFSPIVSLSKSGKVTTLEITDKNGKQTTEILDGADGQGGGGGKAIIDVIELPTENIDEDSFYRLLIGSFVCNQYAHNGYTVYCVDGLPEVGEPAANADMSTLTAYYNTQDGEAYGYVDAMLSQFFGVPIGWYPASMLFQAAGLEYKGIITNILADPFDDAFRILLGYVIYSHKDGTWTSHKTIGRVGEGTRAVIFNHPANVAYGEDSHAEGTDTGAYGDASHSEGRDTLASGLYSHAEGDGTRAEGMGSHAEGDGTIARGGYSHAQGKYNIEDAENKYAHIVGNGNSDINRSNAHTLDWNGLGWFAGGLKVGGTGQDDESAEEIPTKSQVQTMIDEALGVIPNAEGVGF